jgi:hypothetical protein
MSGRKAAAVVEYIKQTIKDLLVHFEQQYFEHGLSSRFRVLVEEIEDLSPRDFEPGARWEFVDLRRRLRRLPSFDDYCQWELIRDARNSTAVDNSVGDVLRKAAKDVEIWQDCSHIPHAAPIAKRITDEVERLLKSLGKVLDSWVGADSLLRHPVFPFFQNRQLREIAERDYRDLALRLFPERAWKSVVILAGSILEAILFDLLTRDSATISAANLAARAPPKRGGGKRDIQSTAPEDEWTLNNYIEVAEELNRLPSGWKSQVQGVLRDFRNFVHPRVELAKGSLTEGNAYSAVGVLMTIIEHVTAKHP